MNLSEGQIIAGKFRVERLLGRGGMGMVVAATHLQLGERVALKFLLPEALNHPEATERFTREARAAVRIKSEHVVRVSDVGVLENGAPFMVMEYLEGLDLSAWLTQRGRLPIEQAVELVLQACEAIAEAHTLGIVHRDLKPANLFVIQRRDARLAVKVLDFGISKAGDLNWSGGGVTKTSDVMGSPLYMSPEQIQSSKDVDSRGDIWALGVVLYELLAGHVPFQGETMAEVVFKVVGGQPLPLRETRPEVPPALERVILTCLEKRREARHQSIAELALALIAFAPGRSQASLERISGLMAGADMPLGSKARFSLGGAPVSAAISATQTAASWGQTRPPGGRRRKLTLALLGVGILAVAGALAVQFRGSPAVSLNASGAPNATASVVELKPTPLPAESASVVAPALAELAVGAPAAALGSADKPSRASPAPRSGAHRRAKPVDSVAPQARPAGTKPASNPLNMQIE